MSVDPLLTMLDLHPIIDGHPYHQRCARMHWLLWYDCAFNHLRPGRRDTYYKARTMEHVRR